MVYNTACYWREFDIVTVHIAGRRLGVLDGRISWPIQRHVSPRVFDPEGLMWPVRVGRVTHRYFAVTPRPGREHAAEHIIENKTLLIHVIRIQRIWRERMCLRKAAATMIQRVFRTCISNPYHPICRNRLIREYEYMAKELFENHINA